jgi:hypothetical protein
MLPNESFHVFHHPNLPRRRKDFSIVRRRDIFLDNLLVRFHIIIGMILVDWPCAVSCERR